MEPWSLEKLTRNNFEWIFWMFDWKCIEKNNIFELVHCARQRNFKSQVAGHFLTYQNYPTAPDGRVNIGWILCEFLASAYNFEWILAWFWGGNFGSKIWRVNFEWISAWISREFWVNFEWIFSKQFKFTTCWILVEILNGARNSREIHAKFTPTFTPTRNAKFTQNSHPHVHPRNPSSNSHAIRTNPCTQKSEPRIRNPLVQTNWHSSETPQLDSSLPFWGHDCENFYMIFFARQNSQIFSGKLSQWQLT